MLVNVIPLLLKQLSNENKINSETLLINYYNIYLKQY